MSTIDQKEYLKKYLGIGKGEKKKKKKKPKIKSTGLKIVDDDIDVCLNEEIKEDLNGDNEDAPQIVSVIDDRPPSLRVDEKTNTKLWIPLGGEETSSEVSTLKFEGNIKISKGSSKSEPDDHSPPRQRKHLESPHRHRHSDITVKREITTPEKDYSPIRRHHNESPSPLRRNSDCIRDFSPVRRIKHEDLSPSPSRTKDKDDLSPPRRARKDNSPPRRARKDNSPPRRKRSGRSKSPRRSKTDSSPPRRSKTDSSPPRRSRRSPDSSPPRRKKTRWGEPQESEEKMKKTLDGKKAGLQNALDLVHETRELKRREDELFKNMDAEISGVNAATVVRTKKSDVDPEEEERKRKKEAENKEKYDRWGKGLKQVEDASDKLQNDLYEMSKPLARYADDNDLEQYLKEQERDGDPMLQYIRQKKRKKAIDEGIPMKQQYQGDSAPNRFMIRPGYRWDGVDRSNGYEKKWFEVQNSRTASIEETYKWSTEDM